MTWFSLFHGSPANERERLSRGWPAVVYAVGDVHGCRELLAEMEDRIVADAAEIEGEKLIVLLGDYVDRGPDSAGVLDHLLRRPPAGFTRIALAGNHEELMLDFLDRPHRGHDWLRLGGDHTLQSYGLPTQDIINGRLSRRVIVDLLASYIPDQHISLLRNMPLCLSLPGTLFVHAGIRRGVPLAEQTQQDMLWHRPAADESPSPDDPLVVHGHTPAVDPFVSNHRICIDTGAFATGILTAARLDATGLNSLLTAGKRTAALHS